MIIKTQLKSDINNWIDQHSDYLYSYALLKVKDEDDAKDLIQETFISAFKNIDQFKHESSEKTWLVTILKNKITDHFRKKARMRETSGYINETGESFDKAFFNENNFGRWKVDINENYFSQSAEGYLQGKEFQHYLELCMNKLPPKLKAIFTAKYIDDEKTDLICKDFEISSSNYWVMIFRSKTMLRKCLENKGLQP